jgi:hypothetical protein
LSNFLLSLRSANGEAIGEIEVDSGMMRVAATDAALGDSCVLMLMLMLLEEQRERNTSTRTAGLA